MTIRCFSAWDFEFEFELKDFFFFLNQKFLIYDLLLLDTFVCVCVLNKLLI